MNTINITNLLRNKSYQVHVFLKTFLRYKRSIHFIRRTRSEASFELLLINTLLYCYYEKKKPRFLYPKFVNYEFDRIFETTEDLKYENLKVILTSLNPNSQGKACSAKAAWKNNKRKCTRFPIVTKFDLITSNRS